MGIFLWSRYFYRQSPVYESASDQNAVAVLERGHPSSCDHHRLPGQNHVLPHNGILSSHFRRRSARSLPRWWLCLPTMARFMVTFALCWEAHDMLFLISAVCSIQAEMPNMWVLNDHAFFYAAVPSYRHVPLQLDISRVQVFLDPSHECWGGSTGRPCSCWKVKCFSLQPLNPWLLVEALRVPISIQ